MISWRNYHGRDIDPIHVRLCCQRARDVDIGDNSVIDQDVDNTGLAV